MSHTYSSGAALLAKHMVARMQAHELYKSGWSDADPNYCYERALQEMAELHHALISGNRHAIEKEAADVANFLMMIVVKP